MWIVGRAALQSASFDVALRYLTIVSELSPLAPDAVGSHWTLMMMISSLQSGARAPRRARRPRGAEQVGDDAQSARREHLADHAPSPGGGRQPQGARGVARGLRSLDFPPELCTAMARDDTAQQLSAVERLLAHAPTDARRDPRALRRSTSAPTPPSFTACSALAAALPPSLSRVAAALARAGGRVHCALHQGGRDAGLVRRVRLGGRSLPDVRPRAAGGGVRRAGDGVGAALS
jgi:hypothetical protein